MPEQEVDIARNLKAVEWLKSELVANVAGLYKTMLKGAADDAATDILANIVITSYLLGKRIGINFSKLDSRIEQKIRLNIEQEHELEAWYGDFTAMLNFCRERKK